MKFRVSGFEFRVQNRSGRSLELVYGIDPSWSPQLETRNSKLGMDEAIIPRKEKFSNG